jgi:hypothetical protein
MSDIYVVFGQCGEYSDRLEWPVTAYTREEDAKEHVLKATEYADAWHKLSRSDEWIDSSIPWDERERREKTANPLDPEFQTDYTGTRYSYGKITLQERFVAPEVVQ